MKMLVLMAQIDGDLKLFQDSFSGGRSVAWLVNPQLIALVVSVLGLLVMLYAMYNLMQKDHKVNGATCRRLCASLGIGSRERKVLYQLAHSAGCATPSSLLISRGGFEHAVLKYIRIHGSSPLLSVIRQKVFAQ